MKPRTAASTPRSAGITLTEILISILILGVGLVSLATLFPIGLLRLREAQRQTRSAYIFQSATADVESRGLFNSNSFIYADLLNPPNGFNLWYYSQVENVEYNPLIQDTPAYGADPFANNPNAPPAYISVGAAAASSGGYGLPFAYDPLWRYQTGIYLDPIGQTTPEARFAAGSFYTINSSSSLLRPDPSDNGLASAHGLQRLTNFNRAYYTNANGVTVPMMPSAAGIPSTFVSPEDVVWQESTNPNYTVAFLGGAVGTPSTVVPDLSIAQNNQGQPTYQPTNDWRFSWMITAQQNNSANGAAFEGNIVVFENRPFSIDNGVVAGETVVEGVFGASSNVWPQGGPGYGAGADRTVLLRWYATQPDPVVKVGDFIADVTYERSQNLVYTRFYPNSAPPTLVGVPNPLNKGEWDNLPAQRCFWYQVQKVNPAQYDPALGATFRSMTVYVNRPLDAKTLLNGSGNPVVLNAALICPYVVNVIPQTFFVR
jgi:type II secretory pathway pseudopilin PulG